MTLLSVFVSPSGALGQNVNLHLAQGALSGEVTASSVILQTRLTSQKGLTGGDVAGAPGVVAFEWSESPEFESVKRTDWIHAAARNDYIVKTRLHSLKPGLRYYYRALYGSTPESTQRGPVCTFKTHPAPSQRAPVSFIVASCMNYAFFHHGHQGSGKGAYEGAEKEKGYPALAAMLNLQPDFWVGNGDNVYYDHPSATRAQTLPDLRRKWHEQHVQERFVQLFAQTSTYWLKDDHDYRFNDCDPFDEKNPSHELGIATFLEQLPIVDPKESRPVTYRTHRVGRDLQIWLVEGRDYRSSNQMPDGPEKTIWGAEQLAWLQRTLLESSATFKILISATPMIGPDDASKRDNHVNLRGFRHEGGAFFDWLKENGFLQKNLYFVTGDRHWKYHSRNPLGFEEFCTGAVNRENARLGRNPGDPKSTDPEAGVEQFYTDPEPLGGFLRISITPESAGQPAKAEFALHGDSGEVLYRQIKSPR